MKEHYTTHDQAVKLKELGFDWPCYNFWALEPDGKPLIITSTLGDVRSSDLQGRDVAAPFLWQAQAWLREVKGIDIDIPPVLKVFPEKAKTYNSYLCYFSKTKVGYMNNYDRIGEGYSTYELALSAGIDAALEILTNKQKNRQMKPQIATTREQSQRLIACGVNPDSADMFYTNYHIKPNDKMPIVKTAPLGIRKDLIPAWSLFALLALLPMEIRKDGIDFTMELKSYPHDEECYRWCISYYDSELEATAYYSEAPDPIEACVRIVRTLTDNGYNLNKD